MGVAIRFLLMILPLIALPLLCEQLMAEPEPPRRFRICQAHVKLVERHLKAADELAAKVRHDAAGV